MRFSCHTKDKIRRNDAYNLHYIVRRKRFQNYSINILKYTLLKSVKSSLKRNISTEFYLINIRKRHKPSPFFATVKLSALFVASQPKYGTAGHRICQNKENNPDRR